MKHTTDENELQHPAHFDIVTHVVEIPPMLDSFGEELMATTGQRFFLNRAAAIAYAMEKYGADSQGRIRIVNKF